MSEWNIQKIIQWTSQHFAQKGIESGRLDAELLLAHTLNCKRLDLYLKFDQPLKPNEIKTFKDLVLRRAQREPVAYILGKQEFYNRPFAVGPGVLIPRPETEHLIDHALLWLKTREEKSLSILDIGCGSGAIAVSLAAEEPRALVKALDISSVACEKTLANAKEIKVEDRIQIEVIDFLNYSEAQSYDLVVSNPPYIGKNCSETLKPEVKDFEPPEALYGGEKGDEILDLWIPKMTALLKPTGLLLSEIGYDQGEFAHEKAKQTGVLEQIEIIRDYSGHPRVLKAHRKKDING